jgi:hypothetical protein
MQGTGARNRTHANGFVGDHKDMSPQLNFTRIPLQVGSELRIRNSGELNVSNPSIVAAPALNAADAVLDYRFDPGTGEHVLRLLQPSVCGHQKVML